MMGVPAKQTGWMSSFGNRINLPLKGKGEYKCLETGDIYLLKEDKMFRLKAK